MRECNKCPLDRTLAPAGYMLQPKYRTVFKGYARQEWSPGTDAYFPKTSQTICERGHINIKVTNKTEHDSRHAGNAIQDMT